MKLINISLLNIATLFLILTGQHSTAQINANGIPFIKNYTPQTYAADAANWAATKDHRGMMYFGNKESVLEYDGHNWKKISVPNQEYVQALATGPDGTVYIGGIDDFGHLIPGKNGQTRYESLAKKLLNDSTISRIRKIHIGKKYIYFSSFQHLYKYAPSQNTITTIDLPSEAFNSFFINGKFYQDEYSKGLMQLQNDSLQKIQGGDYFIEKDIFSILNWNKDTLLISAKKDSLVLFDLKSDNIIPFEFNANASYTNKVLSKKFIYTGTTVGKNLFAFGTMGYGVYVINRQGKIVLHIDKGMGLQEEIVSNLYHSEESGILWATLSNGISAININSPVRKFGEKSNLEGAVLDISLYNNQYHVATMLGVYKLQTNRFKHARFKVLNAISDEIIYSILNLNSEQKENRLIAGGLNDLYEIRNTHAETVPGWEESVNILIQSKINPDKLFAGTYRGIRTITLQQGKLNVSDSALGNTRNKSITEITEDPDGTLWCKSLSDKHHISPTGEELEIPQRIKDKNGKFFRMIDNIFFISKGNIYRYYINEQDFKLYDPLTNHFKKRNQKPIDLFPLNDTIALAQYNKNARFGNTLITKKSGQWHFDTVSLNLMPSMQVNSVFMNYPHIVIGGQEGIFVYHIENNKNFRVPYHTNIRKVNIGRDSIIYNGAKGYLNKQKNTNIQQLSNPIEYKYNNLTFHYAATYYEKENALQYSSKLKGFDNKWSTWQKDISRTYTNLKEGTYQFHVKAKNIYGVESYQAVFEFEILPPWFRTWWAYLIYMVLALFIIRVSIKLYTRKLREDKRKLEAIVEERTAEIVEKNKRIEKQNRSITDSIKYAKRIQTAVLPNKQTCQLFEHFIYFRPKDIVSGDFFWVYHFEKQKRLIVIAADCTGHGVPGAFMSMLGTSFLNDIVGKFDVNHSEMILNQLRDMVIRTLSQGLSEEDHEERKDGMDIALASIDLQTMTLEFSGAHNPLVLIRNNEILEYKPDKMPIGAYVKQDEQFTRKEVKLQKGDIFYMFSDGFVDQFGGPDDRKYMKKRFKKLLLSIHQLPVEAQKQKLKQEMDEWLGEKDQIDDQIVIGMRILE